MAIAQQAQQPNRQKPEREKIHGEWHTANTKYGMGDNYGTGIRQKLGRVREDSPSLVTLSNKKIGTPPKSLA